MSADLLKITGARQDQDEGGMKRERVCRGHMAKQVTTPGLWKKKRRRDCQKGRP